MPFNLQDVRVAVQDSVRAAHEGLSFGKESFLEKRRLRGESPAFTAAWDTSSFIGGWLGRPEAELLFELAGAVAPGHDIVEVGSYLGRSTAFLALAAPPGCTVHSVDPHTMGNLQRKHSLDWFDTSKQFLRNMEEVGVRHRVESYVATSVDGAHAYRGKPVGLLFIDSRHTETAVYEDGQVWSTHVAPGCFVVFDDIQRQGVTRGTNRLAADGIMAEVAGRVGKVGLCGPAARWPARVRAITRPV